MDEESRLLDKELRELAAQAQMYPPRSFERRQVLTKLIQLIFTSGRVYYPHSKGFSPQYYQAIYEEACQRLMIFVCQNIDNYNPQRGQVMTWVNFFMRMVCFNEAIREVLGDQNCTPLEENCEQSNGAENQTFLSEQIRDIIEADIDEKFTNTHIRNHPEANFRKIALDRLSGKRWQEISIELQLPIPTLSDFYQRRLRQFAAIIRERLSEM